MNTNCKTIAKVGSRSLSEGKTPDDVVESQIKSNLFHNSFKLFDPQKCKLLKSHSSIKSNKFKETVPSKFKDEDFD